MQSITQIVTLSQLFLLKIEVPSSNHTFLVMQWVSGPVPSWPQSTDFRALLACPHAVFSVRIRAWLLLSASASLADGPRVPRTSMRSSASSMLCIILLERAICLTEYSDSTEIRSSCLSEMFANEHSTWTYIQNSQDYNAWKSFHMQKHA